MDILEQLDVENGTLQIACIELHFVRPREHDLDRVQLDESRVGRPPVEDHTVFPGQTLPIGTRLCNGPGEGQIVSSNLLHGHSSSPTGAT